MSDLQLSDFVFYCADCDKWCGAYFVPYEGTHLDCGDPLLPSTPAMLPVDLAKPSPTKGESE